MRSATTSADDSAPTVRHKLAPLLRRLVPAALLVLLLAWFARGFLWSLVEGFMLNVLPIVFTPVILELSVGFVGLFIVLMFAYVRRRDHESEWVYVAKVEPEAEMEAIPEPLRKRVGETIFKEPNLSVPEAELPFEAIEGMLELGMIDEAERELAKGSEGDRRLPAFVRLRLALMLRREDWVGAGAFAVPPPANPESLAVTCVEVARFFIKQKPAQKEAARQCLELGKKLSVNAVVNAIDADGRLQKLA